MGADDEKRAGEAVASAETIQLDEGVAEGGRKVRHAAGDVLGGRYQVIRFLARGGMGAVYEAYDQELEQVVALKELLARGVESEVAVARFKREIQLARMVTHPNVCRIFELGIHTEDGATTLFLTMEHLRGSTLADEIVRRGKLSPPEALPIARQLAEGLAAAHDVGVVHRDFKSGNVILVPREPGVRAVVTDFGLARAPDAASDRRVTGAETVMGTPAYMAPEQVAGGEVGPAADIYAFGVVLFEMVTGRLPFVGANAAATATKRLTEAPPSPRSLEPALDEVWEQTILRCLARAPADRFASVRDAVAALTAGTAGSTTRLEGVAPRPARGWRLVAALGLLAVALGAGLLALRARRTAAPAEAVAPLAVAVLPLRPDPERSRDAWVATALRAGATAALDGRPTLRVVAADEAEAAAQDAAIGETARLTDVHLARLRRRLGVDRVVAGSYRVVEGGAIEVVLALQDAAGGAVVAEARAVAARDQAAAAGARAAGELLRLPGPAREAAALGTARAWLAAGDRTRAREAARPLCRDAEARAAARGAACEIAEDGAAALAALAPRAAAADASLEELLAYARVAGAAGKASEALAATRRAQALAPDDPRPLIAEAELTYAADPQRSLAAATRALALADARGARAAQAQALAKVAWLSWHQGDLEAALRAAERGRALAATLGRRSELVDILSLQAALHWQRGEQAEAAAREDEVVALAREVVGEPVALKEALNNAGMMHLRAGQLDAARPLLEEAARVGGPGYGAPRFGLAWLRALGGDEAGARAEWRALLAVEAEEYIRVFFTIRLGELDAAAGDAAGARAQLAAGLAAADRAGVAPLRAEARVALAELDVAEGRASEAEALAQEAADQATPLDARDVLAHIASIRARLALARGRLDEARAAVAGALDARHEDALMRLHLLAELAPARRQLARTPAAAAELAAELAEAAREARKRGLRGPAARLEAAARGR